MQDEQVALRYRLLWIDDQKEFVDAHISVISDLISELRYAPDAEAGIRILSSFAPDVILADLQVPPGDWGGLWFLKNVPARMRDVPVIVVSGRGAMQQCIEAVRLGAADYVEKAYVPAELSQRIARAVTKFRDERPLSDYRRLRAVEQRLHVRVMSILRLVAGKRGIDNLFVGLVPRVIAQKTYERVLDNGGGRQEEFLDLLDLGKIIDDLWGEDELRTLEGILRPPNRAARTGWLSDLNEARKIVAHPLRGELSPEHINCLEVAEKIVDQWCAED